MDEMMSDATKVFKDRFGNVLEIGDEVAFNPPYYKGLTTAIVIGFTPQQVRVRYNTNAYASKSKDTIGYGSDMVKNINKVKEV
jgi:hypothetical protein